MGKVTAAYQINKVTCLGLGVKPVSTQGAKIPKPKMFFNMPNFEAHASQCKAIFDRLNCEDQVIQYCKTLSDRYMYSCEGLSVFTYVVHQEYRIM